MISTAGTITDAARMVKAHGAKNVYIAATHGLFCGPALQRLGEVDVERIVVTDTVRPHTRYPSKIEVLSVAPLLAEAIRRIHSGTSVSSLFVD
jgi:ribose-phosphate pyrophosphokinase